MEDTICVHKCHSPHVVSRIVFGEPDDLHIGMRTRADSTFSDVLSVSTECEGIT